MLDTCGKRRKGKRTRSWYEEENNENWISAI
jgi:hypothetical protein